MRHRAEVGVLEDDHGRLAAELEVHALHAVDGAAHHGLAGLGRAGHAHHVDLAVGDERLPDLGVAGDHAEEARGQAGLHGELGEPQGRARRRRRGLHDDGVARGERGAGLPDRHDEREVPRRDARDDADRAAREDRRVPVRERPRAGAVERAGGAREEPQVVDAERQLAVVGGRPRLAGVLDLELREVLGVGLERVGEAEQGERPLPRRLRRPLGLRGARGGGGLVDVGDARRGERRDLLLGGRVGDDGVVAACRRGTRR